MDRKAGGPRRPRAKVAWREPQPFATMTAGRFRIPRGVKCSESLSSLSLEHGVRGRWSKALQQPASLTSGSTAFVLSGPTEHQY